MGFTWIAAGDVNNDGYTDVMFTQWDGGAGIYLLLNNQQGGFVQSTIGGGGTPQGLLLSDLTGNGNLDAVVWNSANNSAWVYMGNGKGEEPVTWFINGAADQFLTAPPGPALEYDEATAKILEAELSGEPEKLNLNTRF